MSMATGRFLLVSPSTLEAHLRMMLFTPYVAPTKMTIPMYRAGVLRVAMLRAKSAMATILDQVMCYVLLLYLPELYETSSDHAEYKVRRAYESQGNDCVEPNCVGHCWGEVLEVVGGQVEVGLKRKRTPAPDVDLPRLWRLLPVGSWCKGQCGW